MSVGEPSNKRPAWIEPLWSPAGGRNQSQPVASRRAATANRGPAGPAVRIANASSPSPPGFCSTLSTDGQHGPSAPTSAAESRQASRSGAADRLDCKRSASAGLPQRCHRVPPKLQRPSLIWLAARFWGIRRHALAHPRPLITRRSQVQILPPLLGKALGTGPFVCKSVALPVLVQA